MCNSVCLILNQVIGWCDFSLFRDFAQLWRFVESHFFCWQLNSWRFNPL